MRLRIGISLSFLPNTFVFARNLTASDATKAEEALIVLAGLGFVDGQSIGGFGKIVASVKSQ